MTGANGEAAPSRPDPDTELDLLGAEDGRTAATGQPFEEETGGAGTAGDAAGGRPKRRPKWREVADTRPMSPADIDIYSTKKTVAQGFMDVALLSANADQLRTLVNRGDPDSPFRVVCIVFLSFSIVLQVVIAICLMYKGRYNINKEHHFRRAEIVNNICMIASVLLTVCNLLASAFTGEVPPIPTGEAAAQVLETFQSALT